MFKNGRIPLWIVATVAGTGVLVVVGLFFYGAYAGVGSGVQLQLRLEAATKKLVIASKHIGSTCQKAQTT